MSTYQLNKLLYELKDADAVQNAFLNDKSVIEKYRLSSEELRALEAEDIRALYDLGANPYMIRNVYRKRFRY